MVGKKVTVQRDFKGETASSVQIQCVPSAEHEGVSANVFKIRVYFEEGMSHLKFFLFKHDIMLLNFKIKYYSV